MLESLFDEVTFLLPPGIKGLNSDNLWTGYEQLTILTGKTVVYSIQYKNDCSADDTLGSFCKLWCVKITSENITSLLIQRKICRTVKRYISKNSFKRPAFSGELTLGGLLFSQKNCSYIRRGGSVWSLSPPKQKKSLTKIICLSFARAIKTESTVRYDIEHELNYHDVSTVNFRTFLKKVINFGLSDSSDKWLHFFL